MSTLKKNVIVVVLEKGIQLFGSLLLVSILSKSLGVEKFGEWQLLLSYLAIFSAFSIFCASEVIVPRYVKFQNSNILKVIISNVFWARFISTLFVYLVLLILSCIQFDLNYTFLILCFSVVINESISSFGAYLLSQKKAFYLSISRLIAFFVKVILVYIFIGILSYPIEYLAYIWIVEAVITSLFILYFFIKNNEFIIVKPNLKYINKLLSKSIIFGVGLGFFILFRKLDKILFSYEFSEFQLGIYTASSQLTEVAYQLIIVLSSVIAPILLYDKDKFELIKKNSVKIIGGYVIISIITLIFVYEFFPILYGYIFPEKYAPGLDYFLTVMWVLPLYFIDNMIILYLVQYINIRFFLIKWGLTCIIYVGMFYLMVDLFGKIGASIAIIITLSFSFIITIYFLKYKIKKC